MRPSELFHCVCGFTLPTCSWQQIHTHQNECQYGRQEETADSTDVAVQTEEPEQLECPTFCEEICICKCGLIFDRPWNQLTGDSMVCHVPTVGPQTGVECINIYFCAQCGEDYVYRVQLQEHEKEHCSSEELSNSQVSTTTTSSSTATTSSSSDEKQNSQGSSIQQDSTSQSSTEPIKTSKEKVEFLSCLGLVPWTYLVAGGPTRRRSMRNRSSADMPLLRDLMLCARDKETRKRKRQEGGGNGKQEGSANGKKRRVGRKKRVFSRKRLTKKQKTAQKQHLQLKVLRAVCVVKKLDEVPLTRDEISPPQIQNGGHEGTTPSS